MKNTGERLLTNNFISQYTIEHLHRYALALQYVKSKIIVDIASGEGYGSHLLASIADFVTGIDISEEAIKHANKKYIKENLKYIQGSVDAIPLESNSVDVVVSFETIEHCDKHLEMIIEIKRILKPDGLLIISSPDKLNYTDILKHNNEFHVKELYYEEFKTLLQSNFSNTVFLNQKVTHSSIIINEKCNSFYEFTGNFTNIEKHPGIENPVYNIALASQKLIEPVFSSSFNGDFVLNEVIAHKAIVDFYNSKTYKLGDFFVKPLRILKKYLKA